MRVLAPLHALLHVALRIACDLIWVGQLVRVLAQHPVVLVLLFERIFATSSPFALIARRTRALGTDGCPRFPDRPLSGYFVALHFWLLLSFIGGRKHAIMAASVSDPSLQ